MKKTLILTALAVVLAGCGESAPGAKTADSGSGSEEATGSGNVVATVNGVPIYESRVAVFQPIAGPNTSRDDVIENLIISELLSQKVAEQGLAKGDSDLAEQLAIARQTVLGRAYAENFIETREVPESEVQQRYDELKAEFAGQQEYDTSHILLDNEEQAQEILDGLKDDISGFKDLAREHSKDPGSGAQGGALGWMNPQSVVPEFAEAIGKATPGELYPELVQSQFGWHIILVHNNRAIPVPELTPDLYNSIKEAVNREKFTEHLNELKNTANIERP